MLHLIRLIHMKNEVYKQQAVVLQVVMSWTVTQLGAVTSWSLWLSDSQRRHYHLFAMKGL